MKELTIIRENIKKKIKLIKNEIKKQKELLEFDKNRKIINGVL